MKTRLLVIITVFTLVLIPVTTNSFAEEVSSEYYVGVIQWLKANYPPSGTAVVRVTDPEMNLNPEKIDNFDVFVRSNSHTKGLYLTTTETGVSTGVFEGTLFLTSEHLGVGHRLKVAEGDTITAEYEDSTLPASYTEDVLSIIAKSEIRTPLESPLKQLKSGIPVEEVQCKQDLVLIQKYDGMSACVTPETREKLIERGWTKDNNSMLQKVLDLCGCQESGGSCITPIFKWQNETHHIDSLRCEWKMGK